MTRSHKLLFGPVLTVLLLATGAQAQSSASQLHDALRLTPAQEDAWRNYQSATGPDAQQEARARQTGAMLPRLPTPRRLALVRAQMQSDLAAFERSAQAVNTFYAALTPDQQAAFDKQTAPQPQQGPRPPPRQGSTRP